jgi:uncharacterized membrane protein SpoIIM required for sporulation
VNGPSSGFARRREERFVAERLPRWKQLQDLLDRAHKRGVRSLGPERARELGALYRATTSDLALARTLQVSASTLDHLNRLCSAAHDQIYAGARRTPAGRAAGFLTAGFPRLVRRTWKFHALAFGVFALCGLATYMVLLNDPAQARETVGSEMFLRAERAKALAETDRRYLDMPSLSRPLFSWGLIANNVNVTLMLFAAGATVGIGTLFILAFNGISLGGGFAAFSIVGVPELLWTWVAAHGPVELTAIFIAGGAGLRMGAGLILPGQKTRRRAFRDAALDSVQLIAGTAVMLVVAGLLEGFVSPAVGIPPWGKWAIGGLTVAAMIGYFGFVGRESNRPPLGSPVSS